MSIQSKPATQDSREGYSRVFGTDEHINAACCTCARCLFRRAKVVLEPLRNKGVIYEFDRYWEENEA